MGQTKRLKCMLGILVSSEAVQQMVDFLNELVGLEAHHLYIYSGSRYSLCYKYNTPD